MEHSSRFPSNMQVYSALYHDDAHLDTNGTLRTVYHPSQLSNPNSILVLHGGEDISPSLYGQKPSQRTGASDELSARDISEVLLAKRAIELGIPIFGICRGAQLACALAGGSLVQHVENHVGHHHDVITADGEIYSTTTCHHQMMNPWNVPHELIAWSAPSLSDRYIIEGEKEIEMPYEPEVVFFPQIKCLAIQGHPEWMPKSSAFVQYCLKLVEEKLCSI